MLRRVLLGAVLALLALTAWGQVQTTYAGCTDADGVPVAAVSDSSLEHVVASRAGSGRAEIRYNDAILARLQPESRLFLFAHECARHNLGLAVDGARVEADARRADCWALETLERSGLVTPARVDALERDLQFSEAEWTRVPGPPREFRLRSCAAENAARHVLSRPSAGQPGWNACVRSCGDHRRACAGEGRCDDAYERCVSMCDFRSTP